MSKSWVVLRDHFYTWGRGNLIADADLPDPAPVLIAAGALRAAPATAEEIKAGYVTPDALPPRESDTAAAAQFQAIDARQAVSRQANPQRQGIAMLPPPPPAKGKQAEPAPGAPAPAAPVAAPKEAPANG